MDNLPDFDELMECVDSIYALDILIADLKNTIKETEANVVKEATANEDYFVGNKPPSISYLDTTYKFTGFKGELVQLRRDMSHAEAELKMQENKLEALKLKIEIWRTESANKRHAVL